MRTHLTAQILLLTLCAVGRPAGQLGTAMFQLEDELGRIASTVRGTVGLSVVHVESGERVSLRGDDRFSMASVYKLPIALQILHLVDTGRFSLDAEVTLLPSDLRLGRSPMAELYAGGITTYTAGELLEGMLSTSDNTASDILLRLAGGPRAVTNRVQLLGGDGISVDRSEAYLSFDYFGVREAPPQLEWSLPLLQALVDGTSQDQRQRSAAAFLEDPRDTATPVAMTSLLEQIADGRALSRRSTSYLLDMMTRTPTGPRRLKGRLPADAPVAHKTGTGPSLDGILSAVNDVGLITLPGGAGRLAVAAFVRGSSDALEAVEDAIAELTLTAYDWAVRRSSSDDLARARHD